MQPACLALALIVAACVGAGPPPKPVVRVVYTIDGDGAAAVATAAARVMQRRLDRLRVRGATARADGDRILLDLPALADEAMARTRDVVSRGGRFEVHVVDLVGGPMAAIAGWVRASPEAAAAGIRAEQDRWRAPDDGRRFESAYLVADNRDRLTGRAILERYLTMLPAESAFAIPPDRLIGYEAIVPDPAAARGGRPYWRTYYVERAVALDGDAIVGARPRDDGPGPVVELTLADDAARAFAWLTRTHVGHKLVIMLDGRVMAAPIVASEITGGRLMITMGGDPAAQRREAEDLAIVLAGGALPAPLIEDSIESP